MMRLFIYILLDVLEKFYIVNNGFGNINGLIFGWICIE